MMYSIGPAHFNDPTTDWKPICGQDKKEILFERYTVSTTENKKYVTCESCLELIKERNESERNR